MGIRTIKMPDIGEGIAEAELVEWLVAPGDLIAEDQALAAVMTDKATVEIPATFGGKVVELGGEVGKVIAIGAPLIRIEVEGEGDGAEPAPTPEPAKAETPAPAPAAAAPVAPAPQPKPAASAPAAMARAPRPEGEAPLASPAVRARARDAGIDLRTVPGTGPAGRITHADLDAVFAAGPGAAPAATGRQRDMRVTDIKVVGLRRMIADKMSTSRSRIPHITYVEDTDVTKLEDLRETMNRSRKDGQPKLTMLPFLIRAMVIAIRDEPVVNARYDDDNGVVHQYGAVHAGIAVQTPTGLVVANLRHAEARGLWDLGAELNRLAEAGRQGRLTREELTGSTITITSLGPMGGISHTPIINHPEVAIVGVNKMQIRPVWDGSAFVPRKVMNLSSSFDHRIVDGWNAASFIQRIKTLMEEPALLFTEGEA
ncbi:MAG: 2-oxo acid dehydrogenase subunit E2 [Rhodobacterales bacterium]|nr:2-oxo acid dehydrogenase subunit E2 [Rhodobacterales bacterium]MDX5501698.1 2-oxo acid dehydrogenase subunit E2 [Rhodobacterales bacterium]